MCHLNGLRVAQEPLPLPGDLKYMWADVTKVIDELHLKNHKDIGPAMRNTHLQPSRRTIRTTIQWPANRCLHGSVDIRRFYVPCRRFTFTFFYIEW